MSNEPSQSAQSDINEAFEALRREVSLTRHAVEGLTAARERIPDYSTSLGQIIDALKRTLASLDRIEKSPAVQLTPDAMALNIHQASATARADDVRLIRETRDAMARSVATMDQIVERGRAAREQVANLIHSAIGGSLFALVMLLAIVGVQSTFTRNADSPRKIIDKSEGTDLPHRVSGAKSPKTPFSRKLGGQFEQSRT